MCMLVINIFLNSYLCNEKALYGTGHCTLDGTAVGTGDRLLPVKRPPLVAKRLQPHPVIYHEL